MKRIVILTSVCFLVASPTVYGATLGQVDDFQGPSLDSWDRGTAIAGGGPLGAGDDFLRVNSTGGGGPDSRLITFNQAQWSGDYLTAGITGIQLDVNNTGGTDLLLRVVFGDSTKPNAGGSWYASTAGVPVLVASGWLNVFLPIESADLTLVEGADSYADVMSSVTTMRILSSAVPAARGDRLDATLGIDNVTATPEPTTLGLIVVGAAAIVRRRRR